MKTKLFKHTILALASSLGCLFVNPPAANSQANSQSVSYFCQPYQEGYATFARTSVGVRPIIIWDNRQAICNTVSSRFQVARDNGNLRFLVREGERICGTDRYDGNCRSLLFVADTEDSAKEAWNRLINSRLILNDSASQIVYDGLSSNNREYFNLELYLEDYLDRFPTPS